MPKKETIETYSSQMKGILESTYSAGYSDGFKNAKSELGKSAGITHCVRASSEEVEKYGIDLYGWCSECKRPLEGRWIGFANFCPNCGKIIEWTKEESMNHITSSIKKKIVEVGGTI